MHADLDAQPAAGWPGTPNLSRAGTMWFAGQPGPPGLRAAAAEGVRLVISLRFPQEMAALPFDEAELANQLGMEYAAIPVSPQSFCAADVDRFAGLIERAGGPVLVHCGASDRVGAMWAAYAALRQGLDLDAALEAGRKAGLCSGSMVQAVRRVTGPRFR